ncbi:hypothetical protein EBZ37_03515, partial [bacterium]|nr:hypothetical protein [bacterium]
MLHRVWVSVFAALFSVVSWAQVSSAQSPTAPRTGMLPEFWASGIKQAFGTAYENYDSQGNYSAQSPTAPISKVWFTVANGILTEVYWPTLDRPQIRDLQFLVTDSQGFFWEERRDGISRVEWLEVGVPAFRITTQDMGGRFIIEKLIFTDPDHDVVRMKVRFMPRVAGLRVFLLHNPTSGGTPMSNNAVTASSKLAPGSGLFAWDGEQAQALVANVPFLKSTAAFSGTEDPYQDILKNLDLRQQYGEAWDGNVVLAAEIPASNYPEFELALGFESSITKAFELAQTSLSRSFGEALEQFSNQCIMVCDENFHSFVKLGRGRTSCHPNFENANFVLGNFRGIRSALFESNLTVRSFSEESRAPYSRFFDSPPSMTDPLNEFLVESLENLDQYDSGLLVLEKNPDSPKTVASIFRTL